MEDDIGEGARADGDGFVRAQEGVANSEAPCSYRKTPYIWSHSLI